MEVESLFFLIFQYVFFRIDSFINMLLLKLGDSWVWRNEGLSYENFIILIVDSYKYFLFLLEEFFWFFCLQDIC